MARTLASNERHRLLLHAAVDGSVWHVFMHKQQHRSVRVLIHTHCAYTLARAAAAAGNLPVAASACGRCRVLVRCRANGQHRRKVTDAGIAGGGTLRMRQQRPPFHCFLPSFLIDQEPV